MQNKKIPFVVGGIIVVVALIVVFAQKGGEKKDYYPAKKTNTIENTTVVTPDNTTPPIDVVVYVEYSMTEVATHNNKSDCWTTINGGVYNVTSWISQHPGGEQAIIGLCGIDGSGAFNGQHGGQSRPESELATFKIGTLKK